MPHIAGNLSLPLARWRRSVVSSPSVGLENKVVRARGMDFGVGEAPFVDVDMDMDDDVTECHDWKNPEFRTLNLKRWEGLLAIRRPQRDVGIQLTDYSFRGCTLPLPKTLTYQQSSPFAQLSPRNTKDILSKDWISVASASALLNPSSLTPDSRAGCYERRESEN
ncbi:hypothetical protein BDW02DRAFT_326987 [Decorospora gaudefroyi]|uniref:Uncharacterized protein n=1 Tax=Decorospora gaudefroyi TaxID=184978 RepID=A0A6A5KG77_9PLEO|nr:hypothetical protein BDW02DRAFT_326987 [Decorospora gaudefroyi]